MVIEGIIDFISSALLGVLNLLPTLDISIPGDLLDWFVNLVNGVAWFFPMQDVILIFTIWIAVTNFDVLWKIIQRIWDALPFT